MRIKCIHWKIEKKNKIQEEEQKQKKKERAADVTQAEKQTNEKETKQM